MLDLITISVGFEQIGSKPSSQGMRRDFFNDAGSMKKSFLSTLCKLEPKTECSDSFKWNIYNTAQQIIITKQRFHSFLPKHGVALPTPLPCHTRINIRLPSISEIFNFRTSPSLNPLRSKLVSRLFGIYRFP